MSGHITRMSRGSSVGSSASRPSSTSRSTSTWRAGPWQLCTWTERSSAASVRPCGRTAFAAMSDCSQPSRVSGRSRLGEMFVGLRIGGQAALQFAQVAPERRQQRMARRCGGWCPSRRGIAPRAPASARHSSSLGCGSHRCRSWWADNASSSSISVHASRVCPNSDSRAGRSARPSRSRVTVFCVPDVRGIGGHGGRPAPATAPAARPGRSRGRPASPVQPVDEQLRTLPGVRGEQAGQPARHRVAPARGAVRPRLRRREVTQMRCQGAAPRLVERCSRSPRAAARPLRPATMDPRRPCR